MDDESGCLAFRRLVASVAGKLHDEDVRKLVYIHLYTQRETYFHDAKKLDVFVALECAEIFSPANPEGLLNILEKDLKNRQLAQLVKVFIREKKHRATVKPSISDARKSSPGDIASENHLRMCYKVALAQANVLVKHLDMLRLAVNGKPEVDSEEARKAVQNISETAAALAKLKEKAEEAPHSADEQDYGRPFTVIIGYISCDCVMYR